jgi:thymidylate synthase (FAD)
MAEFIRASYEILTPIPDDFLQVIERIGRVCYKSEDKITDDSAVRFVSSIIKRGHLSVIEHVPFSVRFICDRGVSHEIVRHRLASFSQESSRYCDYNKKGVVFIIPCWSDISPCEVDRNYIPVGLDPNDALWLRAMLEAEVSYQTLRHVGWKPEQARSVLPNSLKTELVVTANLREWRHILQLRTSQAAHPQMRELVIPLLTELKQRVPVIFDDLLVED